MVLTKIQGNSNILLIKYYDNQIEKDFFESKKMQKGQLILKAKYLYKITKILRRSSPEVFREAIEILGVKKYFSFISFFQYLFKLKILKKIN